MSNKNEWDLRDKRKLDIDVHLYIHFVDNPKDTNGDTTDEAKVKASVDALSSSSDKLKDAVTKDAPWPVMTKS